MLPAQRQNIAIVIAFTFHFCGAIGIVFTPFKAWFISNTILNLVVVLSLIFFTHFSLENNLKHYKKEILIFTVIAIITGFWVEVVGVNTGILFGNYTYGNVLGYKLYNVPILIGIQWFVTVYCCGVIMNFVNNWATKKFEELGETKKNTKTAQSISLLIDAALLATFFDFILEPAAQKLGYWQWQNNQIPFYNYTCWFFISAVLLYIFNSLQFNKLNKFAIHLFIIQLLFFITIRLYL